jgi:hypothetical protein
MFGRRIVMKQFLNKVSGQEPLEHCNLRADEELSCQGVLIGFRTGGGGQTLTARGHGAGTGLAGGSVCARKATQRNLFHRSVGPRILARERVREATQRNPFH